MRFSPFDLVPRVLRRVRARRCSIVFFPKIFTKMRFFVVALASVGQFRRYEAEGLGAACRNYVRPFATSMPKPNAGGATVCTRRCFEEGSKNFRFFANNKRTVQDITTLFFLNDSLKYRAISERAIDVSFGSIAFVSYLNTRTCTLDGSR